jgi:hypothetical protein
MKIGELKKKLRGADQDASVYYDFGKLLPTVISSCGWCGSPNMGWRCDGVMSVKEFLAELESATDGRIFIADNGKEYIYNDDNVLYVDNPGELSYTAIVNVEVRGQVLIVHTECQM